MIIKSVCKYDIRPSEITDKSVYQERRRFIRDSVIGTGVLLAPWALTDSAIGAIKYPDEGGDESRRLTGIEETAKYSTDEKLTVYKEITSYNNFYELGVGKGDPAENAAQLKTKPWTIKIAGECEKPGSYNLEEFIKPYQLEERIYRLRCVEA